MTRQFAPLGRNLCSQLLEFRRLSQGPVDVEPGKYGKVGRTLHELIELVALHDEWFIETCFPQCDARPLWPVQNTIQRLPRLPQRRLRV